MHRRTRFRLRPLWKTPKRPPLTGCSPLSRQAVPMPACSPYTAKGERSRRAYPSGQPHELFRLPWRVSFAKTDNERMTSPRQEGKRGRIVCEGSSRTETPPILVTHEMISIPNSAKQFASNPRCGDAHDIESVIESAPQNRAIGNVVLQRSTGRPCRGERKTRQRHILQFASGRRAALFATRTMGAPVVRPSATPDRTFEASQSEFWPSPDKALIRDHRATSASMASCACADPQEHRSQRHSAARYSILQLFRSASCSQHAFVSKRL